MIKLTDDVNIMFENQQEQIQLRVPQARVLRALMPKYPDDDPIEWPVFIRASLAMNAGYTAISGTITRALNGIRDTGNKSGEPYLGLIDLGLVEVLHFDIEGRIEINYRITSKGIKVYQDHVVKKGEELPKLRAANLCTNLRYTNKDKDNKESEDQL